MRKKLRVVRAAIRSTNSETVSALDILKLVPKNESKALRYIDCMDQRALYKLALEVSLFRKTAPKDYEAMRKFLGRNYKDWKKGKGIGTTALKLVTQKTKSLRKTMFRPLMPLFEKSNTWQLSKLFRYPLFERNAALLQDFCEMVINSQYDDHLSLEARFNIAALCYVISPDELFDRYMVQLSSDTGDANSTQDLSEACGALDAIASRFAARREVDNANMPRKKKLRIALCVSGQMRGYEEAHKTWASLGLDKHDTDVYVHTWRAIGRRYPNVDVVGAVERVFEDSKFVEEFLHTGRRQGIEYLEEQYPQLFKKITADSHVDVADLKKLYGKEATIVVEDEASYPDFTNQDKMHYKIYKAYELALQSGKQYDLIIRIRPDKMVKPEHTNPGWNDILAQSYKKGIIFTESPAGLREDITVGDQFAAGTPELMNAYSNTWISAHDSNLFGMPKQMTGHSTLAYVLLYSGIKTKICPGIRFSLPVDANKIDNDQLKSVIMADLKKRKGNLTETDRKFAKILKTTMKELR